MTAAAPFDVSLPAVPRIMHIPEEVEEYFAGEGKVASLAYAHPGNVGYMEAAGRHAVLVEELPEEIWSCLRRFGYQATADGAIRKIDCLLYAQDTRLRDAQRAAEHARFARMRGLREDWVPQTNEQLRRESGGRIGLTTMPGSSPHHVEKRPMTPKE